MELVNSFSILKDIVTLKDNKSPNSKHKLSSGVKDVYNSYQLKKNLDSLQKRAQTKIKASRNPRKTGVINPNLKRPGSNKAIVEHFGNHNDDDSQFSDEISLGSESEVSVMGDPTLLISRADSMIDNGVKEREIVNKNNTNDSFLNQYGALQFGGGSKPVSSNAVDNNSNVSERVQTERNLALAGGYSNFGEGHGTDNNMGYGVTNDFWHINMVPQFRGKTYGTNPNREYKSAELSQRKMENFSGTDNIVFKQKTEHKPLFDPIMNATNIYGIPLPTDYLISHYIPGREKRNELPFQQKRQIPGLNLGYEEHNPIGNDYRPQYKTIDEQRTSDKQQISYTTPVVTSGIRCGGGGGRGPVIGAHKKNRPERTKEWGTDRLVKNYGYAIAPAIYGEYIKADLATTNRGLIDRTLSGPAQNEISQVTPSNLREKFEGSLKQNYLQAEPRNMILVEGMSEREDALKYIPDPTQREQNLAYVGPAGGSTIGRTIAYDPNDTPDTTLRQIHNRYDRDGVAIQAAFGKSHTYNPNDVPEPTRRNIHDRYDRDGAALQPSLGKSYAHDKIMATPDPTRREIHSDLDRANAGANQVDGGRTYTINYNLATPDPTRREIHSALDRANAGANQVDGGRTYTINYDLATPDPTRRAIHSALDRANAGANQVEGGRTYTINYDLATPDPTRREIHSALDRANAGANQVEGGRNYTINYDLATPDPTRREIHSALDRANAGANQVEGGRNYTINYDLATPDPTRREIHSALDRSAGGAKNQLGDKGYAINYELFTPDPTRREMYSKLDRSAGGANGDSTYLPPRRRDDYINAHINVGREQVEMTGRTPTLSNYDKGPTYDFTMLRMCEKLQIDRDLIPSTIAINEKLPFIMSFSGSPIKTMENPNIDTFTKQNLSGNPYINNVVHKAI